MLGEDNELEKDPGVLLEDGDDEEVMSAVPEIDAVELELLLGEDNELEKDPRLLLEDADEVVVSPVPGIDMVEL